LNSLLSIHNPTNGITCH